MFLISNAICSLPDTKKSKGLFLGSKGSKSKSDNININLRFQWRFAPVSDLFIVYTNNSYPENFHIKDKALVAKISYWFN